MDVIGCLSIAGQEYLAQAESLDNGQSLSFSQLEQTAAQLEEFTNEQGQTTELFGGDVQVAGRVLDHLLRQLQSYATSEAAGRDEIAALYEVSAQNYCIARNFRGVKFLLFYGSVPTRENYARKLCIVIQ